MLAEVQAMPASQLNGISGQPNFDHPSTSTSSPARPNLQAVSPTPSPAVTSSSATQLSAAAPSFYPASPSTLYAPPAQSATAEPLSAAPFQTPSFVAHPSVPAAPTLMSDALPAVAPEATRSPPSPPTEDFTAADMQSTAEEIGAQRMYHTMHHSS